MLHRVKHYRRNMGTRDTLINLIVVAYLGYVFFENGINSAALIIAGLVFAGALVPRLFLTPLVRNPVRSVRLIRAGQIAILVWFVLNFSGAWIAPTFLWVFLFPLIGALLGTGFWVFSDPRILTMQGFAHYHAYADGYDSTTQPEENDRDRPDPAALTH